MADPRADWTHVLMPNMAYACGLGDPLGLDDGGPKGRYLIGVGSDWGKVTCPSCRALGHRAISRATHLQQTGPDHVCEPPVEDLFGTTGGCYWQSIPPETDGYKDLPAASSGHSV